MDPRRFYGGIHTIVKDFPDSSADEDLSDDEQLTNRRRNVLPPSVFQNQRSLNQILMIIYLYLILLLCQQGLQGLKSLDGGMDFGKS
ncbi:hypothetical protein EVAR_4295_1 [Eumeta japonica]|uniref:Uncharacterized protein n=1 Tax=Eumeta variegata TaxID=151549 RepID=A0A4C1VBA8_EUMVA|nr:hypothetical protein EVAR_4295_1 [Eumeta japonica]